MNRINELENKIMHYAQLYYEGKDTISDFEFDNLVDELKNLDPNNAILHSTGWGYKVEDDERKVSHPIINVGGLPKSNVNPNTKIHYRSITPKYDGASVELIYSKNKLVSAITRGDGVTGQKVYNHLLPIVGNELVKSQPGEVMEWLKNTDIISISGEFILSKTSWKINYPDDISHRNIPSGFLNRKDIIPSECLKFSFVPYRINAVRSNDYSKLMFLQDRYHLQSILNELFEVKVPFLYQESDAEYQNIFNVLSNQTDYNFDGLVVNDSDTFNISYQVDPNTKITTAIIGYNEIAYKVVTETVDVIVNNIDWNLTRTGRYVPVIEYDSIELSGAMCSRATAHNAKNVIDNGINIGSVVKITRSGEIIPKILDVLEPVFNDDKYYCPDCGTELVLNGVDLVCPNKDCNSKNQSRIYQWISYIGFVKGAGGSLYNNMISYANIKSIEDFYTYEDWSGIINLDGMGNSKLKVVNKVINQIKNPQKLEWILTASNISNISEVTSKKLVEFTNIEECLESNDPYKLSLSNAKGLDQAVRKSIENNWDILYSNYNIVKKYCGFIKEKEVQEDNSNKLKICVTGKLECGTRSVFFDKYKDYAVETDIKNCDYLVTNNPNSGSSKNRTAIELGKKVITEKEFCKLIGEN